MNKIDVIILIIIGLFTVIGYYRGLLGAAFSLVQYIAVIYFAILLTPIMSQLLISIFKLDVVILDFVHNNPGIFGNITSLLEEEIINNLVFRIINVISIILLFILLKLLFSIIFSILKNIAKLPIINEVNKIGGIILGIIEGVAVAYLLMILVNWIPISAVETFKEEIPNSKLGNIINSFVPSATDEIFTYVSNFKSEVEKE